MLVFEAAVYMICDRVHGILHWHGVWGVRPVSMAGVWRQHGDVSWAVHLRMEDAEDSMGTKESAAGAQTSTVAQMSTTVRGVLPTRAGFE